MDALSASVLRLPPDAPVRRLAVRLAAEDAICEAKHRCECGAVYRAVGRPPRFFNRDGEVFSCRQCSRVL